MRGLCATLLATLLFVVCARAEDSTHVTTNPRWLKVPNADDLARFWPAAAGGMGGSARISCIVTSRGTLDKCVVVSEEPAGHGFGASALLMAPLFLMQAKTDDGVPTGGAKIFIPIRFQAPAGMLLGEHMRVANNLPWRVAPTAAELAASFPAQAAGHSTFGRVVLRCRVAGNGGLKGCTTATEEPRGEGFARAALVLAHTFVVADDLRQSPELRDISVDVPFDFRDPRQPSPPIEVNDPEWLQMASQAMAGRLFPEAAAKAGLTTGRAFVACEVAHDGGLIHCAVRTEDPAGLGFGASALAIAGVMKMNPWTKQGAPVDGAHIVVPIRLNIADSAPPAQTDTTRPSKASDTSPLDQPVQVVQPHITPPSSPPSDSTYQPHMERSETRPTPH